MTRCRAEKRTYNLPYDERMPYMLSHGRVFLKIVYMHANKNLIFMSKDKQTLSLYIVNS